MQEVISAPQSPMDDTKKLKGAVKLLKGRYEALKLDNDKISQDNEAKTQKIEIFEGIINNLTLETEKDKESIKTLQKENAELKDYLKKNRQNSNIDQIKKEFEEEKKKYLRKIEVLEKRADNDGIVDEILSKVSELEEELSRKDKVIQSLNNKTAESKTPGFFSELKGIFATPNEQEVASLRNQISQLQGEIERLKKSKETAPTVLSNDKEPKPHDQCSTPIRQPKIFNAHVTPTVSGTKRNEDFPIFGDFSLPQSCEPISRKDFGTPKQTDDSVLDFDFENSMISFPAPPSIQSRPKNNELLDFDMQNISSSDFKEKTCDYSRIRAKIENKLSYYDNQFHDLLMKLSNMENRIGSFKSILFRIDQQNIKNNELSSIKLQIDNLTDQKRKCDEKVFELEQIIKEKDDEISHLLDDFSEEMNQKEEKFHSLLCQKDNEIEVLKTSSTKAVSIHFISHFDSEESDLCLSDQGEIQSLKSKISTLEQSSESSQRLHNSELSSKDEEIHSLKSKIFALEQSSESSQTSLRLELSSKDGEIQSLKSKISSFEQSSESSQTSLRLELSSKDEEIHSLKSKISTLEQSSESSQRLHNSELSSKDEDIQSLKSKISAFEQEREENKNSIEWELSSKDEEIQSLKSKISSLEQSSESSQTSLRLKLSSKDGEIQSLKSKISSLEQEREENKNSIEWELSSKDEEIQSLKSKISEFEQEREENKNSIEWELSSKDEEIKELNELNQALRKENSKLADSPSHSPHAQEEKDSIAKSRRLQQKVSSLSDENTILASECQRYQEQCIHLQKSLENAQSQLCMLGERTQLKESVPQKEPLISNDYLKGIIMQYFSHDDSTKQRLIPIILNLVGCTETESQELLRKSKSKGVFSLFGR